MSVDAMEDLPIEGTTETLDHVSLWTRASADSRAFRDDLADPAPACTDIAPRRRDYNDGLLIAQTQQWEIRSFLWHQKRSDWHRPAGARR
jgi:hypothetical protein